MFILIYSQIMKLSDNTIYKLKLRPTYSPLASNGPYLSISSEPHHARPSMIPVDLPRDCIINVSHCKNRKDIALV